MSWGECEGTVWYMKGSVGSSYPANLEAMEHHPTAFAGKHIVLQKQWQRANACQ